jgi:hypothetical protein
MSWREMVPVFEVFADDKTGRWLGDPKPTLEQADLVEWSKKRDVGATHYRTIKLKGKTCALIVHQAKSGINF